MGRLRSLTLLLTLAVVVACSDSDLKNVANALNITARSVGEAQTIVIEANKQGLVSNADTVTVLELCQKIDLAGKKAVALTRDLQKLDPQSKTKILDILKPIIAAVNEAVSSGSAGIKHQETRDRVKGVLIVIQSTLSGLQAVLALK